MLIADQKIMIMTIAMSHFLTMIDYDKNSDRQSLDNKDCGEEDNKGNIETESDCSQTSAYIFEENDELTALVE